MPQGHTITPEFIERVRELNAQGLSDPKIAAVIGAHRNMVGRARRKGNIAPTEQRHARFEATPEQLKELLTTSDREMQRKYGVNNDTWARVRRNNGIARFRAPTSGKGIDLTPKKLAAASSAWKSGKSHQPTFNKAPRDHSLTGEAADFLRTERWVVINRAKVYGDSGWNVGRMLLTAEEMIAMAVRRGFVIRPWMGIVA